MCRFCDIFPKRTVRISEFIGKNAAGRQGKTRKVSEQKFRKIAALKSGQAFAKPCLVGRVGFVLRFGGQVSDAREKRAFEIFLQRGNFQRPGNDPVFGKDQVGVFSHDLGVKDTRRPGKFAAAVEGECEDPLETALRDGKKLCSRDVFSQKHTEIGRHVGRGARNIRKNGARKGCVRVEYELFCFSARIQQDVDFVARGLDDFVDFSAAQLFVEFSRDVAQRKGVLWHDLLLFADGV